MNHRCGARLTLSLPAILHVSGGEKLRCDIDDLGCGGAFVTLPPGRELPHGLVVLETWLPYAEPQHCRWRALVIHHREHGIGMMFDELQLEDFVPFMAAVQGSAEIRARTGVARARGALKGNSSDAASALPSSPSARR